MLKRSKMKTKILAAKNRGWKQAREAFERFAGNPAALISAVVLILLIVIAFIGPAIAPYDPIKIGTGSRLHPPSREFWFGTDQFGRDIFSRVLYGTRLTLQASLIAVVVARETRIWLDVGWISGFLISMTIVGMVYLAAMLLVRDGILRMILDGLGVTAGRARQSDHG